MIFVIKKLNVSQCHLDDCHPGATHEFVKIVIQVRYEPHQNFIGSLGEAMKYSVEIDDLPPCVVNHLLCHLVESAYCRLLNFVYNIGPKGSY